ncbi:MAG: ATP-binding protein, partial [Chitinophagales bacterium]
FKRVHSNNKYSGSGIGLAICSKIIKSHNAEISVQSTVGEGTTFSIKFGK